MIPCENLHPSLARHYFLHTKVWKVFKHIVQYCTHRKFQLCKIIAIAQVKIAWLRLAHKAHKYRHKICKFGPLTGMIPQKISCNLFAVILSDQQDCKNDNFKIRSRTWNLRFLHSAPTSICTSRILDRYCKRHWHVPWRQCRVWPRHQQVQVSISYRYKLMELTQLICCRGKNCYFPYAFAGCLKMLFSHAQ